MGTEGTLNVYLSLLVPSSISSRLVFANVIEKGLLVEDMEKLPPVGGSSVMIQLKIACEPDGD